MVDCEGKDIQVGDRVLVHYFQYRIGTLLAKGKVHRLTKMKMEVNYYKQGSQYLYTSIYYPREVFKL